MSADLDEPPRRRLRGRRADTVQRITDTAREMLREVDYQELTLQAVTERAQIARATTYAYFASKDHLVAETYWRYISAIPTPLIDSADPRERVVAVLRHLATILADEPGLANAMTATLANMGPDVREIRIRTFHYMRTQLVEALGENADPETIRGLEMLYIGATLPASTGPLSYQTAADELERAARRFLTAPATCTEPPSTPARRRARAQS